MTAWQATVRKEVAASGPLASTMATRSPRPIPAAFRAAPVRSASARKAWNESGGWPGRTDGGGVG